LAFGFDDHHASLHSQGLKPWCALPASYESWAIRLRFVAALYCRKLVLLAGNRPRNQLTTALRNGDVRAATTLKPISLSMVQWAFRGAERLAHRRGAEQLLPVDDEDFCVSQV
jgi:hypothetical protein